MTEVIELSGEFVGQRFLPLEYMKVLRSSPTSVTQLEDTYARWLKRTDERLVAAFDAYDAMAIG